MATTSTSGVVAANPIGRTAEIREIDRFLDRVSVGLAAMVLHGEPGIGKTRLWRHCLRQGDRHGYLALVVRQREADATTELGGLADLLGDLPADAFAVLPKLQRDAIDVALLRSAPSDPGAESSAVAVDGRVLAAGVLSLVRSLARDTPVLVAIDDAQWLDPATLRMLGFAARRLERDRVGFLLTFRHPGAGGAAPGFPADLLGGLDDDHLTILRVGPLSMAAVHEVIRIRTGVAVPRPTLVRIHEVSQGNPFHALQLATAFIAAGGQRLAGEALPIPHDLEILLGERVDALTPATRATLEALAALSRPTVPDLASLAGDGARIDARIDEAIAAGLVELDGATIHFTHPLLGTAVDHRASVARRRAIHRRIAETTSDSELRAYHLALAADGPDESLAVDLERASARASVRGQRDRALALLEHAVVATPPEETTAIRRRTVALAEAAFEAGDSTRATMVLESLRDSLDAGRERAEILARLGSIAQTEDIDRSVELLQVAAAEAGDDIALRARILSELARFPSWLRLGIDEVERITREAIDLAERVDDRTTLARSLGLLGAVLVRSGRGVPHELMARAIALEADGGPIRVDEDGGPSIVYAEMLADGDDLEAARDHVERLVERARAAGDLAVSYPLYVLAYIEYDLGHWERAEQVAAESLDLSVTAGREATEVLSATTLAFVRGGLGDVGEARRLGQHGLEVANRIGRGGRAPRAALGLLELSRDDAAAAWRWLEPAVARIVPLGLDQPTTQVTDGAEALAALGRFDEADRLVEPTESNARRLGTRWTIAMVLRAKAAIAAGRGDLVGAESMLDEALTLGSGGRPLESGRSLLALGAVRRRLRRKRQAADALTDAMDVFDRLSAPIWAERARREMGRVGGRGAAATGDGSLSATEREIARLARRGGTNREIAEELDVSPKTVEWNLTRIYQKLGVRSRTELAAREAPAED